jgi:hypothetical protein
MLEQVWRPNGKSPELPGKGLAIQAAVAIWRIDQGKTHAAAELIRDWRDDAAPQYERMASRPVVFRSQLDTMWTHQPGLLELLQQGDPGFFHHLSELRDSALNKW